MSALTELADDLRARRKLEDVTVEQLQHATACLVGDDMCEDEYTSEDDERWYSELNAGIEQHRERNLHD